VPAYLKDLFGTRYVGAIHGMLLTAWSAAGIFGPVLVNYIRQWNVDHGVPPAQAYNVTMYVMAVLLIVGFVCNFFIKDVAETHHMSAADEAEHSAAA
jgi:phosphotransferase system  glucose/maltose/N-acetylglucosamine-specific IIC component